MVKRHFDFIFKNLDSLNKVSFNLFLRLENTSNSFKYTWTKLEKKSKMSLLYTSQSLIFRTRRGPVECENFASKIGGYQTRL